MDAAWGGGPGNPGAGGGVGLGPRSECKLWLSRPPTGTTSFPVQQKASNLGVRNQICFVPDVLIPDHVTFVEGQKSEGRTAIHPLISDIIYISYM